METTRSRLNYYRKQQRESGSKTCLRYKYGKAPLAHDAPNNARSDDGQKIYTDKTDQYGDYIGDCAKLLPRQRDIGGWYADSYQDATITGGVTRMRSSKGTYYIPVTACTGWDGTMHYIGDAEIVPRGSDGDAHDNAMADAAMCANECARIEAEHAQEEDIKWQAERQIEEAREEIHQTNKATLALIREVKLNRTLPPAICQTITDTIRTAVRERTKMFNRIDLLTNEPWRAVS